MMVNLKRRQQAHFFEEEVSFPGTVWTKDVEGFFEISFSESCSFARHCLWLLQSIPKKATAKTVASEIPAQTATGSQKPQSKALESNHH